MEPDAARGAREGEALGAPGWNRRPCRDRAHRPASDLVLLRGRSAATPNFEAASGTSTRARPPGLSGVPHGDRLGLLIGPLLYLFRAAEARSPRVRGQLVGVVILGPLLLGVAGSCWRRDAAGGEHLPRRQADRPSPKEARPNAGTRRTTAPGLRRNRRRPSRPLAACRPEREDRPGLEAIETPRRHLRQFGFAVACRWSSRSSTPVSGPADRPAEPVLGLAGDGPGHRSLLFFHVRTALVRLSGPAAAGPGAGRQTARLGVGRSDPLAHPGRKSGGRTRDLVRAMLRRTTRPPRRGAGGERRKRKQRD